MRHKHPELLVISIIIASFLFSYWLSSTNEPALHDKTATSLQHTRIISLAPSITETLFALGLGDHVVGVTRYCKYPVAAQEITELGGYNDPSFETIIALKPTLIVSLKSHERVRSQLSPFNIKTITLNNDSIEGILESIEIVGKAAQKEHTALTLSNTIRKEISNIKKQTKNLDRPRVLITVGRQLDSIKISDVFIAGDDHFYSEMIKIAGGINAYQGNIPFPTISGEGIMNLNPDIIIDIIPDLKKSIKEQVNITDQWASSYDISATRNNNVFVLDDDYMVIPGPRFIKIIRHLAKIIHPELVLNTPPL